jgi:hypothetical protein
MSLASIATSRDNHRAGRKVSALTSASSSHRGRATLSLIVGFPAAPHDRRREPAEWPFPSTPAARHTGRY